MPYLSAVLDQAGVARLLRISPKRFAEIRPELEANGFPLPLQPIDRWLRAKVEEWLSDQADEGTPREHLRRL